MGERSAHSEVAGDTEASDVMACRRGFRLHPHPEPQDFDEAGTGVVAFEVEQRGGEGGLDCAGINSVLPNGEIAAEIEY